MYLPPLQPVSNSDIYICGDVIIHPSAAIAAGVILKAAPNSRIVIGEGVCLGMGTILNASQGIIEVENGAVLGAGVLIIGEGKIGHHACIGTATTIFNASVEPMQVITGSSLIGDVSRKEIENDGHLEPEIDSKISSQEFNSNDEEASLTEPETTVEAANGETKNSQDVEKKPIFGQIYVNQLLVTLFPQSQNINLAQPDNK
jgi:carbon dioxide concentrating mechanism protein CcmN